MKKLRDNIKNNDFVKALYFFLKSLIISISRYKDDIRIHFSAIIYNTTFTGHNRVHRNSEVYNSVLGQFSYVSYSTVIQNAVIGKFCSIGPGSKIGLGKHPTNDYVSSNPLFFSEKSQFKTCFSKENAFKEFDEIVIGNDVWIGANSIILDGVKIGNGAIVGAGSVVTKNIKPYTVCVGVPAREIRKRFTDDDISFLEELNWWDMAPEFLKEHYKSFQNITLLKAVIDKASDKIVK